MTFPLPDDEESAREDGRYFGQAAGMSASSKMVADELSPEQLKTIGAEEVALVLARADAMAGRGVPRELVAAWTEAAADAFTTELDRAVALLKAREASERNH